MESAVRIDLERIIKSGEKVVVDVGCGNRKKPGRIGIDRVDLPGVDIVADIEKGLSYFPDESVDEIHCRSVLQHIEDIEELLREMLRVLKKNGRANIFVPHFSNPYYYSDYTHVRFFGLYTFQYFVDSKDQLKRKVPNYYSDIRLRIVSQRLRFRSSFALLKPLKRLFAWVINRHSRLQEFYEENLCYAFPCHGIEIVFTGVK